MLKIMSRGSSYNTKKELWNGTLPQIPRVGERVTLEDVKGNSRSPQVSEVFYKLDGTVEVVIFDAYGDYEKQE